MKKQVCTYPDFEKLDLRVGEIVSAEKLEGSKKLLVLKVDLGEDYGVVEILSGIAPYYPPEKLIGNKYIFIANLAPRPLMGRMSNGMILATDREKCYLIKVPRRSENGTPLC